MKPRKRLFLGLSLFLFSLLFLLLVSLGYILQRPEEPVLRYSLIVVVAALALMAAAVIAVLGTMTLILIAGSYFPVLNRLAEKAVVYIFPLILHLGKFFRITQDQIQRSFIEINNRLLEARGFTVLPQELLVLLPHCLQEESCPHKITRDPFNCRRCGRCPIHGLLALSENWKVNVQVVTGGTLARQAVKLFRPRFIIAVACERDLASGIIDSFPLPVWGLLNERPFGPCFNTFIADEVLENTLQKLVRA